MASPQRKTENDIQVERYADFINLNLQLYPELRWLAEQGLTCPVPEGWEIVREGQTHYFRNVKTGATRNDHPMDDEYRVLAQRHMAEAQDRLRKTSAEPSSPNKGSAPSSATARGMKSASTVSSSSKDVQGEKKKKESSGFFKRVRYIVYMFIWATMLHFFLTMTLTPLLATHLMPQIEDALKAWGDSGAAGKDL